MALTRPWPQVGGVHIFHIDDLRRIAPRWLNFTRRVRKFACDEPERYYKLAAPPERSWGRDGAGAGKVDAGRRRQFMWMVRLRLRTDETSASPYNPITL